MAGIYIHIPFCKQACHYCDFHFSTQTNTKAQMVEALIKEMALRRDFLNGQIVDSIYFGGGTPSMLSNAELPALLDSAYKHFTLSSDVEITLEANPDDLTMANLQMFKEAGINRLSVGIQSFMDSHLTWMNRGHRALQAICGIQAAQDVGLTNISADLIFGFERLTGDQWDSNISQMMALNLPHISAYILTVEPKTVLGYKASKGQYLPPDDTFVRDQFITLHQTLEANGYCHYEISNYCLPGKHSRHNSSYWAGEHYLGIGPSAHSYNGSHRMWNIANNPLYISQLTATTPSLPLTVETLSRQDNINEAIITGLRTKAGIELSKFRQAFGDESIKALMAKAQPFIAREWLTLSASLSPTLEGYLMADYICGEMFG